MNRDIENQKTFSTFRNAGRSRQQSNALNIPSINLPKGGGAIKGIEDKFQVNAVSGTSSFAIPLPLSPSRAGSAPALGLSYNSGNGNGPFGLGWSVGIPAIVRKTQQQLPQYRDEAESDTFILTGAEDLVPLLEKKNGDWIRHTRQRTEDGQNFTVARYRPRVEGSFARIEKWKNNSGGDVHWRVISASNVHSYYGLTPESRISDPADETKVFEWLLCQSHADKGSFTIYRYKKEDFAGIPQNLNEKNRINNCTQIYIKQVLYGIKQPWYLGDALPNEDDFMFKVVFDYGEHDTVANIPLDIDQEKNNWPSRQDAFSSYRSGFEIRTWRRCSRVMMFHCFDEPDLPHSPYLVKSLDLSYEDGLALAGGGDSIAGFSFLVKARQNGHQWDAAANHYRTKHLPDLEMTYHDHQWNTSVEMVSPADSVHAPVGVNDIQYRWIDLFSEGISGILTEQANAWFYKSNLGNGRFSNGRPIAPKPSSNGLSAGLVSIQELEGDGVKCLVQFGVEPKGYFRLSSDQEWEPFRNFESLPILDALNPNMRSIDLSGDGRADFLLTEENRMRWYPGAGEKGFEISRTAAKAIDEEKGPAILFSDRAQNIFLADMSGDGLTDIVRIRNGEVCYWPNLGYGRFGAKVNMDDAPLFDHPDSFNPAQLRLADIDGSGTIDLVYLGKNDFRVWMNLNGNAWTKQPQIIDPFPQVDNLADISVLDFLGSGTACIVHSSPLPDRAQQPVRYIDLMGGRKPGLFSGYRNNLGKEVSVEYTPSTHFYLEDRLQGRPWITKLPFPVHCLSKTTVEDKVRETIFTNSYRYSHGYFDSAEKEFRGFARVEQYDTESFSQFKINAASNVVQENLHQPPVKTISWFHTGAYLNNKKILHQCENEYFQNEAFGEYEIPEPVIEADLSTQELLEAYRACKGIPLRTEIYAEDGSDKSDYPYSATHSSIEIRRVQPLEQNRYASFLVIPSESVSYVYERNPADPRVSQDYVLETDELGNVTKLTSVVYPRVSRPAAPDDIPDKVWEEQNKLHVIYGEALFTDDISKDTVYRLRVGYETKSYELSGISQPPEFFISKQSLAGDIAAANEILFEVDFTAGLEKRLVSHSRSYFVKDDLSGPTPLGQLTDLAIGHNSFQLAFTKNLVGKHYGTKVDSLMLLAAGYEHSEGDEHWWMPSGTVFYMVNPENSFFTPIGARDPFGNESTVEYDNHFLMVKKAIDAIGNTASSVNDYRTMSPILITDPNLNRAAVETDELGLVIKSALMGKAGAGEGDTLADPTARMEYDFFNWRNHQQPNFVHTFTREKHGPANPRWQENYIYSDGGGNVIMAKVQAEPGKAKKWNAVTNQVEEVDADPRWVGNGRTILNNKGNAVKQYEPYFSDNHDYESEAALVETGISPVFYYDPVGRNTRTEFPNGTFAKVELDGWSSKGYDVNDTVKDSQWYADRGSPDPNVDPEPNDTEQRAAWLAAKHDNTPGTAHTDSLGISFYSIADYGNGKTTSVFSETDFAERYSKIFDQLGRLVAEGNTNLLGQTIYGKSAEKGERWTFTDVMGRLVKVWENNVLEFRSTFDKLHRPVSTFVKQGGTEFLFGHIVYGDLFPDVESIQRNLKGKAYQFYDQAGKVTVKSVDFKGNVTEVERQLTKEYDQLINWQPLAGLTSIPAIEAAAAPLLEDEIFSSSSVLDALNRPALVTLPDESIVEPIYNEANSLDSLRVKIRGQGDFITFLKNQDYDAKGQRQFAQYGNGLLTNYFYDPKTFRLVNLVTKKTGTPDTQSLQNLHYTYDPVGNIVHCKDDAQQTHYFSNAVVKPESRFEYDAIYRLLKASGREHAGLGGNAQRNHVDLPFHSQLPHVNDLNAVRLYTEEYQYDDCGNIKRMRHIAADANWTRHYRYEYQDDPANNTNRLKSSSIPGDAEAGPFSATYQHDIHGNMTKMPHLDELVWNFMDQLSEVDLGGGGKAFYVYGLGGNRVRKVIERIGGKKIERIYLGAVEIYREYQNNNKKLERSTLHISDNTGRIAQVDTKLLDEDDADLANPLNKNLIRYQYANHLGSATLETDVDGNVISYEEYHPFGTSAYRSSKGDVDLSLKRYRFSGKERDDESGFYYFGARYYAPWLGRWTSADPAGFADGLNVFSYCVNNPVTHVDPNGTETNKQRSTWRSLTKDIDTLPEFEAWAKKQGIKYSQTPKYLGTNKSGGAEWDVGAYSFGKAGEGGFTGKEPKESAPVVEDSDSEKAAVATAVGSQTIRNNPTGATIEVPDSVKADKLRRLKEGVRRREVGKNAGPGNSTRVRRNAQVQKDALADFKLRRPRPSPGYAAGHKIDMMYDLTGESGNRWRDYVWENGATNTNDGFEGYRKLRSHPQGVPAGGVARSATAGRFYNRPGFRTGMRWAGGGLLAGGTILAGFQFSDDIAEGNWFNASLSGTSFAGGALEIGGWAASSSRLVTAGRFLGAPAAVVSSGILGWQIGTYINENTGISDTAAAGGTWVEKQTGSVYWGAAGAAATAIVTSPYYAGEAAVGALGDLGGWIGGGVYDLLH